MDFAGGATMNQHHLVVQQSLVADVWPLDEASRQRPRSHKPVARLTMVLTLPQPYRATSRRAVGGEAPIFFSIAAAMGFLLAVVIVVLGTISLSGALVEKVRTLPHYNQPQAQYSDLGKWLGHR